MAWWDHDDLRDVRYKRGEKPMVNYNKADELRPGDMRLNSQGEFEVWVQSLGWIPASETQYSIAQWQQETFGPLRSFATQAIRANLEMGELLRAAEALDNLERKGVPQTDPAVMAARAAVAEETADIMIVLMGNFAALGVDHRTEMTRKMQINRNRRWVKNGDGTGQHVREKAGADEAPAVSNRRDRFA